MLDKVHSVSRGTVLGEDVLPSLEILFLHEIRDAFDCSVAQLREHAELLEEEDLFFHLLALGHVEDPRICFSRERRKGARSFADDGGRAVLVSQKRPFSKTTASLDRSDHLKHGQIHEALIVRVN